MEDKYISEQLGIKHIGFIMDGNGRWAQKRGLPRKAGHSQGAKAFEACVENCMDLRIPCVTFYAFSTENWFRPKDEVDALMKLFDSFLSRILKINSESLRLRFIGDREPLSDNLKQKMNEAEEATLNNTGMICNVALNYGGRAEILYAAKKLAAQCMSGEAKLEDVNEHNFSKLLFTSDLPDVDLIIRPSGEMRTSNFLIWQSAYAELIFMDVLWPDFGKKELIDAMLEFGKRNRRFGGV